MKPRMMTILYRTTRKIEPYVIHSYVFIDQFIDGTIMFITSAHPCIVINFGEGMCLFKFNNKLER